jgi:hypothetical protein
VKLQTAKDLAVISTPLVVAAIMLVGDRWNQAQQAQAARDQTKLELVVDILKAPADAAVTPGQKKLRAWAEREFEHQTRIAWTDDIADYLSEPARPAAGDDVDPAIHAGPLRGRGLENAVREAERAADEKARER